MLKGASANSRVCRPEFDCVVVTSGSQDYLGSGQWCILFFFGLCKFRRCGLCKLLLHDLGIGDEQEMENESDSINVKHDSFPTSETGNV